VSNSPLGPPLAQYASVAHVARVYDYLLGGLLGATAGLRPALWVATLGGTAGAALVLLTALPRYRLPSGVPRAVATA